MRKGDFIGTNSGAHFYPLDPKPEEIDIKDIAHALTQICRFNGHTDEFYSVAQHSLMVYYEMKARKFPIEVCFMGLLHDASEGYLCDIPRPLKRYLTNYHEIEKTIQDLIYTKFVGRTPTEEENKMIKDVDDAALCFEHHYLLDNQDWMNTKYLNISDYTLVKCCNSSYIANLTRRPTKEIEEQFLNVFNDCMYINKKREYLPYLTNWLVTNNKLIIKEIEQSKLGNRLITLEGDTYPKQYDGVIQINNVLFHFTREESYWKISQKFKDEFIKEIKNVDKDLLILLDWIDDDKTIACFNIFTQNGLNKFVEILEKHYKKATPTSVV
jgi:hypothetical protein